MLVTTWNDTISNFGKRTVGHLLQDERDCPRDLEPSPKWKCKQWKTTDHYFFDGGWEGGGGGGLRGWKIFTCKQFFCVSVFMQTLLFLIPYNLFQCVQPLQTIYFTIFQPRPPQPRQKNNGPSLSFFNLHTLSLCKCFYNKSSIVS